MAHLSIRKRRDKSKPGPPWPLAAVLLQDPNVPVDHIMSIPFVENAQGEGWLVIRDDVMELRFANATVRYQIIEGPGRHTDAWTPAGYRVEHQYTLHLIEVR